MKDGLTLSMTPELKRLNIFNHIAPQAHGDFTVAVKANIAVKDMPHSGGIKAYDALATKDALVVERLRRAGAAIIGTVNMEEGALGAQTDNPWFGKTHNPLKIGYTPGGSSGGSAAAVAAGLCNMALGTDTMGSVRIPSSYCGIWGFKPSYDAQMLDGVMPLAFSLDTVGIHGRDLETTVKGSEIICARDFKNGQAPTINLLDYTGHVNLEPDVETCFQRFAARQGAMSRVKLSGYDYGASRRAGLIVSEVEGYAFHAEQLDQDPDGFSESFRAMLFYGRDLPLAKIDLAYEHIYALRRCENAPFILMPTAPQTAFKFGTPIPANQADFTAFANLTGRPALQFPIGYTAKGLPIGAQIVGPRGGEADLIAAVKTLLFDDLN